MFNAIFFFHILLLKKSNILNSWKNFPYISIFFIYSPHRLYEQHIAKLALPHVWSLFSLWSINPSYSCNFKVSCRHYYTSSWILWLDFNSSWPSFSCKIYNNKTLKLWLPQSMVFVKRIQLCHPNLQDSEQCYQQFICFFLSSLTFIFLFLQKRQVQRLQLTDFPTINMLIQDLRRLDFGMLRWSHV